MIPFDLLQGPAVVLGIAGAVLVTGRSAKVRAVGFGAWIVGNSLWVTQGLLASNAYLIAMFGLYWITAVVGLHNCGRSP